ncbi:MAG: tetratricopeptide repeat protein, partial [Lachnospiraceae bacterium]
MDMKRTLQELDQMFVRHQIGQAERFLKRKMTEATEEHDYDSLITLLNEMIGLLRDISHYEECCSYCRQLTELLDSRNLQGTIPYATSMLNVANAYRAAGKLQESLAIYRYVKKIYEEQLAPEDFRFASLNNNLSLLYQEMGDFAASCECLKKALLIARTYKDARIEVAVTHSNLAMSLLRLGLFQEAMENLEAAFAIFEADEEKDFHYSAALSAMGEAQYMAGNLSESARFYEMALHEIEKNTGKSQAYEIVKQNLDAVRSRMRQMPAAVTRFDSGMALCEAFYKEYGEPMIREKFPEYQESIAAGLVGEGSE